MELRLLGPTGLRVSELCLGAMTFGTEWGWGASGDETRAMLRAFADAGGNFVDTADAYTDGTSEELLGRFLEHERDRWVIATKYTISTDRSDPNAEGNGRKNLIRSLEASLRRLRTDYVDLYWVHMFDGVTPVEEVVRALDDAVRAGKVLHVGFSDFPAWLVARADALAQMGGLTRPAAIQVEYNLAARDAERELLPMAAALGLGVLDWSPLGGGALTGKHLDGRGGTPSRSGIGHFARYATPRVDAIARAVVREAEALGCSPAQLAIAWAAQRGPAHIPIVGARSVAHVEDNLRAAGLAVPRETLERLEAVSAIELGWPQDFLREGAPQWFAHAGRLRNEAA
jgi:aryl-alcohol dehydrogenase-like predicted oxidoreductase